MVRRSCRPRWKDLRRRNDTAPTADGRLWLAGASHGCVRYVADCGRSDSAAGLGYQPAHQWKIIEQACTSAHSNAAAAWRMAWSNSRPDSSWGCNREGTARAWGSNRPGNGRGRNSSPTATAWGNSRSGLGMGKCRSECTTPAGQPSRPRRQSRALPIRQRAVASSLTWVSGRVTESVRPAGARGVSREGLPVEVHRAPRWLRPARPDSSESPSRRPERDRRR